MKIRSIITQLFVALTVGVMLASVTDIHPVWFIGGIVTVQQVARLIPMPAGLMFFNFTDLEWNDSLENMGGFTSIAYFAPLQDIETFPTLKATPATDEEFVVMTGHYVMKATKFFVAVYVTPETASLAANNQGETDGQSFRLEGEIFYPGSKTECKAFARKLNNTRGVLILVDPDGDRTVVGTKEFPCYFKPNLNYGKAAADRKGLTIAFYQNHFAPGLEYNGSIPLDGSLVPAIS
ncbi:MAG: hypothetical protein UY18_C0036G0002 [Microgenomates group bacterium GW2011_GWF2_47_9]|nr:MAG: hypothetical protein UY18_C0036G0002 [Microgenomates group bacterium GW2011_GWF2_47_9]